jgi:hypothetical protein
MTKRELERLSELLFKLSIEEDISPGDRDSVGELRFAISDLLDVRETAAHG